MKKLKSPVDLTRSFANGVVLKLPANEWVTVDDNLAAEMKFVYPFIEMAEATEEDLKKEAEQEVEEVKKEEEKTEEEAKEVEKPKRRGRPPKKQ